MKIAFISTMSGFPWGGSEELWHDAASAALDAGHEVGLFLHAWSPTPPKVAGLVSRGAGLFTRPLRRHPRIEQLMTKHLHNWKALERFKPDVILISQGHAFDAAMTDQSRGLDTFLARNGIPYVVLVQWNCDLAMQSAATRAATRNYYGRAAKVCFVAAQNLRSARRQICSNIDNGLVVANPVNLKDRTALPFPSAGIPSMACVARLDLYAKRQDILLEVLSDRAWRDRAYTLDIYGSGPDESFLGELITFYGLSDRVHLAGVTKDIRSVWASHGLHVLPTQSEGTPLALIEAMLCGRPSVTCDVGGISDWLEDDVTGFVAAAPTASSFHDALDRAWTNRARWAEIGHSAHTVAATRSDPHPGKTFLNLLIAASSAPSRGPA